MFCECFCVHKAYNGLNFYKYKARWYVLLINYNGFLFYIKGEKLWKKI